MTTTLAAPKVVRDHLQYCTKEAPSDAGIRVAELLHEWNGLHHFDSAAMKKVEWSNTVFIELKLSKFFSIGQLSTFDFDSLTRLVFLAHDHCIRASIAPCNPQHLSIVFHPRSGRDGQMS